jgi:hypothetical protein
VGCFGHSELRCFTPSGAVDRAVRLPTSQVTMCAFGGDALDTLFVTTGTFWLDPLAAKKQTLAGAVFAVTGSVLKGCRSPNFWGSSRQRFAVESPLNHSPAARLCRILADVCTILRLRPAEQDKPGPPA